VDAFEYADSDANVYANPYSDSGVYSLRDSDAYAHSVLGDDLHESGACREFHG